MNSKWLFMAAAAGAMLLLAGCLAVAGNEIAGPQVVSPLVFAAALAGACFVIGIFAVMAGVGGGVIFTPLMLGFTPLDSYVVRATGLFIAMAGSLIASRTYYRKGLANWRLVYLAALPAAGFALVGALLAGYIHDSMGVTGEALIRGVLGLLVIGIGGLFLFAGKRSEYPKTGEVDGFTAKFGLGATYWEASLNRPVEYRVKNAGWGLLLFSGVGLVAGLFGLGAGWAIVPVFNLVMLAPLKAAAASSQALISMGSTAGGLPYLFGGGMLPMVVIPALLGMLGGTWIGSKLMLKAKPAFVRKLIIGVMFVAGIRLVAKAVEMF